MGILVTKDYSVGLSFSTKERPDLGENVVSPDWEPQSDWAENWILAGMVFFPGLVLGTVIRTQRHFSSYWDICYVQVWNPLTRRVQEIVRHDAWEVTPDASPEVRALAQAWQEGTDLGTLFRSRLNYAEATWRETEERRQNGIAVGRKVVVVKGRKVPPGTSGVVFWTGTDNYGKGKVGISPSGVKQGRTYPDAIWVAMAHVVPQNPRDGFY